MPKKKVKAETLEIRLTEAEKSAFVSAADASGLSLSSWARERLRRVARTELVELGKPVSFDAAPHRSDASESDQG